MRALAHLLTTTTSKTFCRAHTHHPIFTIRTELVQLYTRVAPHASTGLGIATDTIDRTRERNSISRGRRGLTFSALCMIRVT